MRKGFSNHDSFRNPFRTRTGLNLDLPTEAQWEYACRATTTTALNSGDSLREPDGTVNLRVLGRYLDTHDDGHSEGAIGPTTTVGSYQPNRWGLFDMHGNVNEWCLDWYDTLSGINVEDPPGKQHGEQKVLRGGNWNARDTFCRSATRSSDRQTVTSHINGLRIVRQAK